MRGINFKTGLAGLALILATLFSQAAPPYNIVLIMADDCSPKEFSAYGSTQNQTPVLDRLGETGIRFRSAWCTPMCNPTRTEIMTGLYGFHTHRYHNNMNLSTPLTDEGYKLFSNHLRQRGYATAVVGKWQLPQMWEAYGYDEYCVWAYDSYIPSNTAPEIIDHWYEQPNKPSRYWHPAVVTNGIYLNTGPEDYGPDIFVDYAVDFMTRHKDEPFLLYCPMALTHGNFYPTPDSIQPGEDPMIHDKAKNFGPMVEYTDKMVGRIINALDSILLADGSTPLREKTIVMFCTDNANSGDGKSDPTENGCSSPLVINCPGSVPAIGWSDELVDFTDFLPSLIELSGGELSTNDFTDGISFAPYILGQTNHNARQWMFSYIAYHRMLRDKRWLWEPPGRFYDTGGARDGTGYIDVTDSDDPEVVAARQRFQNILKDLPAPRPDDPAYPKWNAYARTMPAGKRRAYFMNDDPLPQPLPPTNTLSNPFTLGPLSAAGAQTPTNPTIIFGSGTGSSKTNRTADVILSNLDTGFDLDGSPGPDTISGTFTVSASCANGIDNAINITDGQNGIRPKLGFDEGTLTLSLSDWNLTAINNGPVPADVAISLDGFNGLTFGHDQFSNNITVGLQTDSQLINIDNGTHHTNGIDTLITFPVTSSIQIGKGIGATSPAGTIANEIRIGGTNENQGLRFQLSALRTEPAPSNYAAAIRTDAYHNLLIELPRIPATNTLTLEFTDDLIFSWTVVDEYRPTASDIGQPFRFEQHLSLTNAFYRIRPRP